jgi:hypothetical protein
MKDNLWLQPIIIILLGFAALAVKPSSAPSPSIDTSISNKKVKVTFTIGQLTDLKVREGDRVERGQIISDKSKERNLLEYQKKQVTLAIATIEKTALPTLKQPLPIINVPPTDFAIENARISQAELKFSQSQRILAQALQENPFVTARAKVDKIKSEIELATRDVQLQQQKISAIQALVNLPPAVLENETQKLASKGSILSQKRAEYDFATAEYEQVEEARKELIAQLQNNVELSRSELEVAQANLRAAKQQEWKDAYNHRVSLARRDEEANAANISLANQQLERTFKLSSLQDRLGQIDEKLNTVPVFKAPISGVVSKIKIISQSDTGINMELRIIP